jgi:hypothetical protein
MTIVPPPSLQVCPSIRVATTGEKERETSILPNRLITSHFYNCFNVYLFFHRKINSLANSNCQTTISLITREVSELLAAFMFLFCKSCIMRKYCSYFTAKQEMVTFQTLYIKFARTDSNRSFVL